MLCSRRAVPFLPSPLPRRLEVLEAWGPFPPWTEEFLRFRTETLQADDAPRAGAAQRDLVIFERQHTPARP